MDPNSAFAAKKSEPITARLIVRRVKDLNRHAAVGQDELFDVWRYHAVFTDSPFVMLQAGEQHCDHAIIEQVLADWTDGPLAHLPSGSFPANAAWPAPARSQTHGHHRQPPILQPAPDKPQDQ